jgi:hypothetical protein
VQEIRQVEEQRVEFGLQGGQCAFRGIEARAKRLDLGQKRRDVLRLGLGLADGARAAVAFVAQRIDGDLCVLPAFFQFRESRDVEAIAAASEISRHGIGIAA